MELKEKEKIKYLSKYNRVWQHIKTGEIKGSAIELSPNEKITDYKEVPKPKTKEKSIEKAEEVTATNKIGFSNYNINKK